MPNVMPDAVARSLRGWTISALLHGLACGVTVLWLSYPPPHLQREPFTWNVSLVESQPAPPQPSPVSPPTPPSEARPVRRSPTRTTSTDVVQTVRTVVSARPIQAVHEPVHRQVSEEMSVPTVLRTVAPSSRPLTEAASLQRIPEPQQQETSAPPPLRQETGLISEQTQTVASPVPSPFSADRQAVSVGAQSIAAAQSFGAVQSAAPTERMVTTGPQSITATPEPAVEHTPTSVSRPASVPLREKGSAISTPAVIDTAAAVRQLPSEPEGISPVQLESAPHPSPPQQAEAQLSSFERALAPGYPPLSDRPSSADRPHSSTLNVKADYGWLARELWDRVERLKRFPRLARIHGWEGKVVVRAVINADGSLGHEAVEESSGYEALDQDALDLMKQVCPLALKHPLGQPQVVVHVPIHYRIEP